MALVQQVSGLSPRPASAQGPFQPAAPCGSCRLSPGVSSSSSSSKLDTSNGANSSQQQQQAEWERRMDRRTMLILSSSLVASYFQHASSARAVDTPTAPPPAPSTSSSSRGLSRYIRKKKLDPLETYVPMVLEAQQQLAAAGAVMGQDVQSARNLLRQGAFSGLRDNIRAIGEYAAADGKTKEASSLLPGFFAALNDFDQVLQAALKTSTQLDMVTARAKFSATVSALDSLLATVPADIMDKSQAVLAATRAKSAAGAAAPSEEDRLLRSLLS